MFEKEAKEYAQDMAMYYESAHGSIPSQFEKYLRNAVEHGYNKANELHYIKDGNLPKENENVLIYSNRANYIGFYRNGFWFTDSDGCLEDDDIEVIAWKEIVLPEESEK